MRKRRRKPRRTRRRRQKQPWAQLVTLGVFIGVLSADWAAVFRRHVNVPNRKARELVGPALETSAAEVSNTASRLRLVLERQVAELEREFRELARAIHRTRRTGGDHNTRADIAKRFERLDEALMAMAGDPASVREYATRVQDLRVFWSKTDGFGL